MGVTVKLFGNLAIVLGKKEIDLDWKGGSLREMVIHLAAQYGEDISKELFDESGEIDRAYVIFLKGERVYNLLTTIEDGDEVVITSMLAGGNKREGEQSNVKPEDSLY